jgi:hypothetical protein
MTSHSEKTEELLDDLFNSATEAMHFFDGIRRDIGRGEYDMSRLEGDIDYLDVNFSVGAILKELLELRDITQEIQIDVWSHFSGSPK